MIDEGTTHLIREGISQIEFATNEFTKFIDDAATRVDAKPQMLIQLEKKKFIGRTDWMTKAMAQICPALLNKEMAVQMDRIKIDYLKLVKATGKSVSFFFSGFGVFCAFFFF